MRHIAQARQRAGVLAVTMNRERVGPIGRSGDLEWLARGSDEGEIGTAGFERLLELFHGGNFKLRRGGPVDCGRMSL